MMGYCITACFGRYSLSSSMFLEQLANLTIAAAYGGGINQWDVSKTDIQKFFQVSHRIFMTEGVS
jgi:hypothetical protein